MSNTSTSLVTGGTGFVASHLVQLLLERGHKVHTTVRNKSPTGTNATKIGHLLALQEAHPNRLTLFEADLLTPNSLHAAAETCTVIYHVASPFLLEEHITDAQTQVIQPALQGTRSALAAATACPSVERVVLTSSIGAIMGDYADIHTMRNKVLTEEYWNETSTPTHNAYHYSKVAAEREAWQIAEEAKQQGQRWDLVCVNPGFVLGPSVTPGSASGSLAFVDELLKGYLFYGAPDLWFSTVDVRDVAVAHLRAAESKQAGGKRFVVASGDVVSVLDMAAVVREIRGGGWWLPRHGIPMFLVRLIGPLFGLSQKWIRLNMGVRFAVDNRRSVDELGMEYRPVRETLGDHYHSWVEHRKRK